MSADRTEPTSNSRVLVACGFIILCVLGVYLNGIHGAYLFDDKASIPHNPSLHQSPWLLGALHPPHSTGNTADGRPILNLTFAVNYLLGGLAVEGFHAGNILIHLLASLVLFGILRRTFSRLAFENADWLAFWITLLWAVHPLNTESVTYMVQRAESLMGLFYLFTLYSFIRSVDSPFSFTWKNLSVGACLLGMGTKEIMVSAPIVVLIYDRTFISGSFKAALGKRWPYYAGLAATWIVLFTLVYSTHARGSTAGFGIGVSWLAYEESQPMAVVHYLRLAFWPLGLNFDYGLIGIGEWEKALFNAPIVLVLGIVSIVGLWRNTAWGLLGFMFFAILAPTSIMPGNRQAMAEHRMYLALIPVVVLTGVFLYRRLGHAAYLLYFVTAVVLAVLSIGRNRYYHDEITLYEDSVAKLPNNQFSLTNLGAILMEDGQLDEAAMWFQRSLTVMPNNPISRDNLGAILIRKGRIDQAIGEYRETIRLTPGFANAYVNLGNALLLKDLPQEAITAYDEAHRLDVRSPVPENGLAVAYAKLGAPLEAVEHYKLAVASDPLDPATHNNMGNAYVQAEHPVEARQEYEEAIRLSPQFANAHFNLGNVLLDGGKIEDAIVHFRVSIQNDPNFAPAHDSLGNALLRSGKIEAAVAEYREAIRIQPTHAYVYYNLAAALVHLGKTQEAIADCQKAIKMQPDLYRARSLLNELNGQPTNFPTKGGAH